MTTPLQLDPSVRAAIYARVSSDQQAQDGTIASQVDALRQRVAADGLTLADELCFVDNGISGSVLVRPALERLRDAAYAGSIGRLYIYSPDRLARHYAYQVVLVEELQRAGVTVVFLNQQLGSSPEEKLFLQLQGMIAEYERALILERSRRGKRHAAQRGCVAVLTKAPYGYRYGRKSAGEGQAAYEIVPEEAAVVRQLFDWVGREGLSLAAVARRLQQQGTVPRGGKPVWRRSTLLGMLTNSAYQGVALYGKRRRGPHRLRLRPRRGQSEHARAAFSDHRTDPSEQVAIAVPALVSAALFAAVQEQLAHHRRHYRPQARGASYLLQGLLVCQHCGYGYCGMRSPEPQRGYHYYRCLGSDRARFGGQRFCWNKQVRGDQLEAAVWQDVCALLQDPQRLQQEYERRCAQLPVGAAEAAASFTPQINKVKQGMARLIDAYADGLLSKSDLEPRLQRAKERLAQLEQAQDRQLQAEGREEELRLVYGHWQAFAQGVAEGLQEATWETKRGIIRALIKRIEIDPENVRIIYKVSPVPAEHEANPDFVPHCTARGGVAVLLGRHRGCAKG
jgi:site-specific DNA recombinase